MYLYCDQFESDFEMNADEEWTRVGSVDKNCLAIESVPEFNEAMTVFGWQCIR